MTILDQHGRDPDHDRLNRILRHWLDQESVRAAIGRHVPESKHPTREDVHRLYFQGGLDKGRAAQLLRTLALCKPVRGILAQVIATQKQGMSRAEAAKAILEEAAEFKHLAEANRSGLEIAVTMPKVRPVRIG